MKRQSYSGTSVDSQSFKSLFSRHDLIWIIVGILIFILLAYAVIHFDIVSLETFTSSMSKYNVTGAEAIKNAQ